MNGVLFKLYYILLLLFFCMPINQRLSSPNVDRHLFTFPTPGREFDTCLRAVESSNQKCKFPSNIIFGGQITMLGKNEEIERKKIIYCFCERLVLKGTNSKAYMYKRWWEVSTSILSPSHQLHWISCFSYYVQKKNCYL